MNFSNIDFPFPLWIVRPPWECALKIGFFVPVIVVSLFGNGFVIYLMATNRFLRTSINIFIWNLATADLLTILLFPWIILIIDLYQMYILGPVPIKALKISAKINSFFSGDLPNRRFLTRYAKKKK